MAIGGMPSNMQCYFTTYPRRVPSATAHLRNPGVGTSLTFPASEFSAARPSSISLTRYAANSQLSPLSAHLSAMLGSARLIALCIAPQGASSSPVTLSSTRGGPTHHMKALFLMLTTHPCRLSPLLPHHPSLLLPHLILPLPLPLHSLLFYPHPLPLPLMHSPHLLPCVPSAPFIHVKAATSLDSTTCTKSSSGGELSNK